MACRIESSCGEGICGLAATFRLDTLPEAIGDAEARFDGCHLLVDGAQALISVESWGDAEAFEAACRDQAEALSAWADFYRLQMLHDRADGLGGTDRPDADRAAPAAYSS
jgi:hypothetical protein